MSYHYYKMPELMLIFVFLSMASIRATSNSSHDKSVFHPTTPLKFRSSSTEMPSPPTSPTLAPWAKPNDETYLPTLSPSPRTTVLAREPHDIIWNNSVLPLQEYQHILCSARCDGDVLIILERSQVCPWIECFSCSCQRPLCEIYGTCCPDISVNVSAQVPLSANKTRAEPENGRHPEQPKLHCDGDERLSIAGCPSGYPPNDVRSKCEEETPVHEQSSMSYLRVSDMDTQAMYFNSYCALCNDVLFPMTWDASISCDDYLQVYQADYEDEFLRLSLRKGSRCHVSQVAPPGVKVTDCFKPWFKNIINTCGVSGQWRNSDFDSDLRSACNSETSVVHRVHIGSDYFKNLFCAICNMETTFINHSCDPYETTTPPLQMKGLPLPFSLLLNFNSQTLQRSEMEVRNRKCNLNNNWASPDGRCQTIHCSSGKSLADGNCATVIESVRGLGYKFSLLHVPHTSFLIDITPQGKQLQNIIMALPDEESMYFKSYLDEVFAAVNHTIDGMIANVQIFSHYDPQLEPLALSSENSTTMQKKLEIKWFSVDAYVVANQSLPRDEFENEIQEKLVKSDLNLTIDSFEPLLLTSQLIPWDQKPLAYDYKRTCRKMFQLDTWMVKCRPSHGHGLSVISAEVYRKDPNNIMAYLREFIMWSPQLTCPFVIFSSTEYSVQVNEATLPPRRNITLYLNETEFVFSKTDDLNMLSIDEDKQLRICLSLLNDKVEETKYTWLITNATHSWLYVLSIVSLGISMFCLALTLVTYSIFSVLRNVVGKYHMMLSATLLFAQASLLLGSHTAQKGVFCTLIGISTHFLWLSMFCWCFVCCFHMFCVFTAKTRTVQNSARSEKISLCKRIIFCLGFPALIVVAVVLSSLLTSGHQRVGYGHASCSLDSILLFAISVATPLGIILLCNCTFFMITVGKIHNTRKLQTHTEFKANDRHSLCVYIKLSTATSAFWSIMIIAEAANSDPLRFVGIVLNGCQGVFIFLSYIFNKRVLKLYVKATGFEKSGPDTSTSAVISTKGKLAGLACDMRQIEHAKEDEKVLKGPGEKSHQVQVKVECHGENSGGVYDDPRGSGESTFLGS